MSYVNACFTSYKRPPQKKNPPGRSPKRREKHHWIELAEAFQAKLEKFLDCEISSFRDEELDPGTYYPEAIAQQLCRSACMVALVIPQYFESKWCRAEWDAMASWEAKRLGEGKRGLIIPIVLKGDLKELDPFFQGRDYIDLRGIRSKPATQFDTVVARVIFERIADIINAHAKRQAPADIDCGSFSLNIGPDAVEPKVEEPSPFGR